MGDCNNMNLEKLRQQETIDRKWLSLSPPQSLSISPSIPTSPPPLMLTSQPMLPSFSMLPSPSASSSPSSFHSHPSRPRRNPSQIPQAANEAQIPSPYPWATAQPATVHTLDYLLAHGLAAIEGDVQCRRCESRDRISYDLLPKFKEINNFVLYCYGGMHDRAPAQWLNPTFTDCGHCGQPNCMKPVVADNNESINWLFLFLGQALGCCTLEQLKFFCKHTQNHRTGAKDRVLLYAYLAICKQLDPEFEQLLKIE